MKAVLVGLADVEGIYEIAVSIDGTAVSLRPNQALSVANMIYTLLEGIGFIDDDDGDGGEEVVLLQ